MIPAHFKFKKHVESVKRIAWLEDDSGFVTCGHDSQIYMWQLYPKPGETSTEPAKNPVWEFNNKGTHFSSIAVFKPEIDEKDPQPVFPIVYATGNDHSIRELSHMGVSNPGDLD